VKQGSALTVSDIKRSSLTLEREMLYNMRSVPLLESSSVSISLLAVVVPVPVFMFAPVKKMIVLCLYSRKNY